MGGGHTYSKVRRGSNYEVFRGAYLSLVRVPKKDSYKQCSSIQVKKDGGILSRV